jgi:hypothetical protein
MTTLDFTNARARGATGHKFDQAREAVVRVGGGRGFIAGADYKSYIITAAHCLPERARHLYPHLGNGTSELLVKKLVGPLAPKRHERKIWAELCGLNQTDDLAVFCEPDHQCAPGDEYERYRQFTDRAVLAVAPSPAVVESHLWEWPWRDDRVTTVRPADAFVLGLDLTWKSCTAYNTGRFLTLLGVPIEGGMSGSPILNAEGAAIGVISTAHEGLGGPEPATAGNNTHPSLMDCLPPWLWRELAGDTES